MKLFKFIVITFVLFALLPINSFSADSGIDRLNAAKELKQTANLTGVTRESLVDAVVQQFPADKREEIKQAFMEAIDYEYIERVEIETMASIYTVAELNAMKAFYSSEAGKSAMAKMPEYMAQYNYAIREEMSRALPIVLKALGLD